ncbi:MAG: hypothetical protein CVU97_01615 [Firmicutes bacterium HGW-Firmicutes-21]|nr:MAG: hypothetical protein CVU97_01615 [Firmicutes bacterium HGW-Firmicutes-21]
MRLGKKIFSMVFCFIIIFSSFAITLPQETEARTLLQVEADLKECETLLNSLQNKKAKLSDDIKKINRESGLTVNQLNLYIQEIEYLDTEIALTEETIQSYVMKLSEIEVNILIQQESYDYYEDVYASIVRYSFMQGDISIFQLLLESGSFTDFLTRVDNLNYFLKYTDSIMESLTLIKKDLEVIRGNYESAKTTLDNYNTDLQDKMNEVAQKRVELEAEAAALGTSLSKLENDFVSTDSLITQTKTKIAALQKERQAILDSNKDHIWPVKVRAKSNEYYVSSLYGWRVNPFDSSKMQFHNGVDIACAHGTPIVATKAGTVTRSEYASSWGNLVVVYHGDGISSLYAHASSRVAKVGQNVKQGDIIAYVGTTGSSTGNHLHYSLIINGNYVDPSKYLPKGYF